LRNAHAAALAAQVDSNAHGPAERRRHRRIRAGIGARFLAANEETPCRTIDVSCGGALLEAADWPAVGERLILVSRELGRLPGAVVRHVAGHGLGVRFDLTLVKRERLAETLTLKANPQFCEELDEAPLTRRYDGAGRTVLVETADGRGFECEVLDFSLLGVALRTQRLRPPLGAWVKVGATYGRVARFIDGGFAVDFGPRNATTGAPVRGPFD
jgi:hypothetical protein